MIDFPKQRQAFKIDFHPVSTVYLVAHNWLKFFLTEHFDLNLPNGASCGPSMIWQAESCRKFVILHVPQQIREQMFCPDLHVFTLKFLAREAKNLKVPFNFLYPFGFFS